MRMLPLVLVLGGAGIIAFGRSLFGRAVVAVSGDRMVPGKVYRVRVRLADGVYRRMREEGRRTTDIARFVSSEAKVAGFRVVHLVTEDPSAPGSYALIAEFGGGGGSQVLKLLAAEEVHSPPAEYVAKWEGPGLDDGLLLEEAEAVLQALRESRDPKHLSGFASTLTPEFPVSASLLRAKSELQLQSKSAAFLEDIETKYSRFRSGMGSVGVTLPETLPTLPPGEFVETLNGLGVAFAGVSYPQALGIPEATWFGESCYRILRAIADGERRVGRAERIVDEAESREVANLKLTGGQLSSMTGFGAGVQVAQYAAACYALMGVVCEGVSLGPAFDRAVTLSSTLTKSDTLAKQRSELSPGDRVRFDVGVLFAETTLLRNAEFGKLWHHLPGTDPAEKAAHLKRFIVLAKKANKTFRELLQDEIVGGDVSPRIVYEAALMLTPELVRRSSPEVADKLGVSPANARAALASVREVSEGVRYLAPDIFVKMGPNVVARELLPPAAMQLAFATMRPEQSMVSDKDAAIEKARAIHRLAGEGGDAAKAKAQFDRAKRALERQKWVDWMRRKRQAESGTSATGIIRS